jgi:hypothetical protein
VGAIIASLSVTVKVVLPSTELSPSPRHCFPPFRLVSKPPRENRRRTRCNLEASSFSLLDDVAYRTKPSLKAERFVNRSNKLVSTRRGSLVVLPGRYLSCIGFSHSSMLLLWFCLFFVNALASRSIPSNVVFCFLVSLPFRSRGAPSDPLSVCRRQIYARTDRTEGDEAKGGRRAKRPRTTRRGKL